MPSLNAPSSKKSLFSKLLDESASEGSTGRNHRRLFKKKRHSSMSADEDGFGQNAIPKSTDREPLPRLLSSPMHLFWFVQRVNNQAKNSLSPHRAVPCRVCHPDEAIGVRNIPPRWDLDEKALIQIISFPSGAGDRILVPRKNLIPYYGTKAHVCVEERGWCLHILEKYTQQINQEATKEGNTVRSVDQNAVDLYLKRVLQAAKEAELKDSEEAGDNSIEIASFGSLEDVYKPQHKIPTSLSAQRKRGDVIESPKWSKPTVIVINADADSYSHTDEARIEIGSDGEESLSESELEIPYTQNIIPKNFSETLSYEPSTPESGSKSKEPIRPGDVITYYTHLYVCGDPRGHRVASVLSVDPGRSPVLVLDNGEFLPVETHVKRIKVMSSGKLMPHPGIFREIDSFNLQKSGAGMGRGSGAAAGVYKESSRLGAIIHQNQKELRKKAEADGFAPMDILRSYKCGNAFPSSDEEEDFDIRSRQGSRPPLRLKKHSVGNESQNKRTKHDRLSIRSEGKNTGLKKASHPIDLDLSRGKSFAESRTKTFSSSSRSSPTSSIREKSLSGKKRPTRDSEDESDFIRRVKTPKHVSNPLKASGSKVRSDDGHLLYLSSSDEDDYVDENIQNHSEVQKPKPFVATGHKHRRLPISSTESEGPHGGSHGHLSDTFFRISPQTPACSKNDSGKSLSFSRIKR